MELSRLQHGLEEYLKQHKGSTWLPRKRLDELINTLTYTRVFIDSREKMHPCGVVSYDEILEYLKVKQELTK